MAAIPSLLKQIARWFRSGQEETSEKTPAAPPDLGFALANYGPYDTMLRGRQDRLARFKDYELMDELSPECNLALNVYADNAVYGDSSAESFKIRFKGAKTGEAQQIVEDFEENSEIQDTIRHIARDLCKKGEVFEESLVAATGGLVGLKYLPQASMWLNLDAYGNPASPDAYFTQRGEDDKILATWPEEQIIHFKLVGDMSSPYGRSILFPARSLFRKIHPMEDAMVLARLKRANARYLYKIDTSGLPLDQKILALENAKRRHMSQRLVDPVTGFLRQEERVLRPEEDLFIGSDDELQLIEGDLSLSNIGDVEYFLAKLFTALGVPKAYMTHDEGVNAKATLTQQDIQFARNVRRVQVGLRAGLKKAIRIALITRGVDPSEVQPEIVFPSMRIIDEALYWSTMQMKVVVANLMKSSLGMFHDEWIYKQVFGLEEDEIETILDALSEQRALEAMGENPTVVQTKLPVPDQTSIPPQYLPPGSPGSDDKGEDETTPNMAAISEMVKQHPEVRKTLELLKDMVGWKLEGALKKEKA